MLLRWFQFALFMLLISYTVPAARAREQPWRHASAQFVYVGAGTYILQYRIGTDGRLIALRPDRVHLSYGSLERWYVDLLADSRSGIVVAHAFGPGPWPSEYQTTLFHVRRDGTLSAPTTSRDAELAYQHLSNADPGKALRSSPAQFLEWAMFRRVTPDGHTAYVGSVYDTVYEFHVHPNHTISTLSPSYVRVYRDDHPRMTITADGRFAFCNGFTFTTHPTGGAPYTGPTPVNPKLAQFRIRPNGSLVAVPLVPKFAASVCCPWVFDRREHYAYGIDTRGRGLEQMRLHSNGQLTPVRWTPVPTPGPPQPQGMGHGIAYPFLMTSITR